MINRSNVDILQLNKGNMKRTLFDCLFVYENYPTLENKFHEKETSLKCENKYGVEKLDYALAVVAHETTDKEHVEVIINYAGELIENDTINDLIDVANHLLSQISKNEVVQILDLNFLPENQFNIIEAWNKTHRELLELNDETTLHVLFEEEAQKSPDKIAVVYEDVQLTYRELNERANRLAHYLRSISNIHPDDLIALILDKSELMIISILGVWKSGAAYVPMDPNYPDQRIEFILKDTKAKIVIANMKYSPRLQSYDILKVEIDSPLLLPIHAIGELCLTGDCLSRGYLNRPELTAERFLPNPFQTEEEKKAGKNTRIYKTGDLVRWLPGGEFEYLGRDDFQVKIRGLRIELGEIEAVLSSYQGVKQCVVLVNNEINIW
ncbi:unnamed protein product [Rotaria sp. Silwood2]|nr:unnamed protein product [Rotaria sp. Silwood2]